MKKMLSNCLWSILLLFPIVSLAQDLPASLTAKIEAILSTWKKTQPGCAVSIVMGDEIVYNKAFGLANVENNIPVTPQTLFTLASISKEFTGYCITLLAGEGKIALDDDIRKYLPWLTDFNHKITIADLLHHTSGLRDHLYLINFTGFPMNGILTQELALSIIEKQKTLDFVPGEKFSYCNANYVLLAEILEKASGKSLAAFADSAIFRPLDMRNTRYQQDPYEIIKDHADSYSDDKKKVTTFPLLYYEHGDGGVLSSSTDLAKWAANFYHPKAGDFSDIARFIAPGKLHNGRASEYGMGVFSNIHRGQKRLMHKGGIAGYKNFIAVYPELKIGIVVLTNGDDGPKTTATMEALAALLVPEGKLSDSTIQADLTPVRIADTMAVKKMAGEYVAHNGEKIHLQWKKGSLYANGALLIAAKGNVWYAENGAVTRYRFFNHAASSIQVETPGPNPPIGYHSVNLLPKASYSLEAYCGTYQADELDYSFTITIKNGKLLLNNHRHGSTDVALYGAEDLYPGFYFIDHLVVVRDKKKQITGLELARADTAGVIFHKIK